MLLARWNSEEISLTTRVVEAIKAYSPKSHVPCHPDQVFEMSAHDAAIRGLLSGLHCEPDGTPTYGTLPVRHLYYLLGFDERRPFTWRLEHKLVQALVLDHFCPKSIPPTCGLSRYIRTAKAQDPTWTVTDISRVVVKPALAYGSIGQTSGEVAGGILNSLERCGIDRVMALADEEWVVQEKIPLVEEYRVHTVEDAVVEDLTFVRHSNRPIRDERVNVNAFVQSLIAKLPSGIVDETIVGWDVGLTHANDYRIIEANLTGLHPVFRPGFQCSGFLTQPPWGPYVTARLLRFVERRYGCQIRLAEHPCGTVQVNALYRLTRAWFEALGLINALNGVRDLLDDLPSAELLDPFTASKGALDALLRSIAKLSGSLL